MESGGLRRSMWGSVKYCNFTKLWMTPDAQMVEDDPEGDLLSDLLQGDFEKVLDGIIQSIDADEA